jgi:4-hydroxy-tetrahydrodipicolinate synthase
MAPGLTSEQAHGLYVPLVTPFDEHGAVDFASLERFSVHLASEPGVTGLVTCARIGEGPVLTVAERQEITRRVKASAGDRVPVVASILPWTGVDALAEIDGLAEAGADAVMVFPPLLLGWGRVPDHVKLEFYRELDASTALPLILFQTPMADYRLSAEVVVEIARLPNVVAMKEASFDMNVYEGILTALAEDGSSMCVLNGNDRFVALGCTLGATGALIGIANLVPSAWAEVVELARADETAAALAAEARLRGLQDTVFKEPILDAVARIKVVLRAEGLISHAGVRKPQCGIGDAEAAEVLSAYRAFSDRVAA